MGKSSWQGNQSRQTPTSIVEDSSDQGTPAKHLGYVDASDEEAARNEAAKEFRISAVLRNRIAVQREG